MRKIVFLAAVALSMTACLNTPWVITASSDKAPPQVPRDSVKLGEQEVDFNVDHDTISVRNHEGSFKALSFYVENNSIELFNVVIDFGNGESQKIETRLIFNEGSRSRMIDLNGRERRIKSIQLTYRTVGAWREGKARVVVYGVK